MEPFPDNRLFAEIGIAQLDDLRAINGYALMAGHTGRQRRGTCLRGFVDINMAKGAIHSKLSGVDGVFKSDRLMRSFSESAPVPSGDKNSYHKETKKNRK